MVSLCGTKEDVGTRSSEPKCRDNSESGSASGEQHCSTDNNGAPEHLPYLPCLLPSYPPTQSASSARCSASSSDMGSLKGSAKPQCTVHNYLVYNRYPQIPPQPLQVSLEDYSWAGGEMRITTDTPALDLYFVSAEKHPTAGRTTRCPRCYLRGSRGYKPPPAGSPGLVRVWLTETGAKTLRALYTVLTSGLVRGLLWTVLGDDHIFFVQK